MLRLHLKSALRFILRNRLFSIINILGMSLGLAAGTYILMFIINEFSYDRFNQNLDSTYRVTWRFDQKDISEESSVTTAGVGPSMLVEFPGIDKMTRLSIPSDGYLQHQEKSFRIRQISYADSSFFNIFSYKLVIGDKDKILQNPFEIVLSESTAGQIFGEEDPVGQTLRLDNEHNLLVTGVFKDVPNNSHLLFNALISFSTLYRYRNVFLGWDGGHNYYTYIRLFPNIDKKRIEERFPDFMERHLNYKYRDFGVTVSLSLQPLKAIHLHSVYDDDVETRGSMNNIFILSSIAVLILLMACVNFINLSTARALKRTREIGVRKVMGATRSIIQGQFLIESALYIILSFILALVMVELFQPWFNQLIGKEFNFFSINNGILFTVLPVLLIVMIVLAGGYPAFYLSRFLPIIAIKGISSKGYSRSYLRNSLVVFQFFITAVLIASGIIIYSQLNYVSNKQPGYQKENVLVVPLGSKEARGKMPVLKKAFNSIPGVVSCGGSSEVPGFDFTRNGYIPEGFDEPVMINVLDIDPDYLNTMGIKVRQGRNFERGSALDSTAYLVNEAFIHKMNWEDPLGKTISRNGEHKVIGVVADFHFASMHKEIAPLILTMDPWNGYRSISIRYDAQDLSSLLTHLEASWRELEKSEPFNFYFLDAQLDNAYREERNFGKMVGYFSFIAIVIACLGLFGLSSFMIEQRRKEVGIRKVLGASSRKILVGYAGNFLKLVLLANILSFPLIWFSMSRWLERFAYRIQLSWTAFLLSFILSVFIAFLTISLQVWRASRSNPIDALREE